MKISDAHLKLINSRGRNPDQLELFANPHREMVSKLFISLLEHGDEIKRMREQMDKVLAGEPGYARDPKPSRPARKQSKRAA